MRGRLSGRRHDREACSFRASLRGDLGREVLMARLQRRRFEESDDVRSGSHGRIDVVEMDDRVVGRVTYEPGWKWSIDEKPEAATQTCQLHHLGVTMSGRLRVQMQDGVELELG